VRGATELIRSRAGLEFPTDERSVSSAIAPPTFEVTTLACDAVDPGGGWTAIR
jgi:hypothetical protein